jgi:hypothetical protein
LSSVFLVRLAAVAAIVAGALRVGTSFAPDSFANDAAELLYVVIDLGLLSGILASYLTRIEVLGGLGFAGFAVALPGAAGMVGPDGEMFGIGLYQVGGGLMTLGLALLGVASLRARVGRRASSVGWLLSLGAAAASGTGDAAFTALGVVFGLAFVALGRELLREVELTVTSAR